MQEDPGKYIPSKAIISQRRAALDMGYTCLQQAWVKEQLQQGAFFYALTDSSPQGGRDYEVTVLDVVLPQDAVELLRYVRSAQEPLSSRNKTLLFVSRLEHLRVTPISGGQVAILFYFCYSPSPLSALRCEGLPIGSERTIPLMCSKIVQMIPPPATLGGRSANASHRLSAFLHSLHLVSGDFDVLRQLLGRLISITTDLGVESLLTKLEPFQLHAFLPFFEPPSAAGPCNDAQDGIMVIPENPEGDRGDDMFAVRPEFAENVMDLTYQGDCQGFAEGADADANTVSLQACRGVAGLLHIIHNAFKDLGSRMDHYEEQVSNMALLSKFLSERHSKERLIAKCFSQGLPAEASFKTVVQTFSSQCYRPRWGTVAKCSLDLRQVLPALRFGWSKEHGCTGDHMLWESARNYGLGMDALVTVFS